jgi:lipoprotein NlpD
VRSAIHKISLKCYLFVFTLLTACGEVPKHWDPQGYTVKRGDTLYSIAWRYEKDYRQVAQLNNIQSPYAIYPGQRLRMQAADKDGTTLEESRPQVLTQSSTGKANVIEQTQPAAALVIRQKPTHATVQKNDTLYSIARREGYSHHQLARWNHLRAPYVLRPGEKLRLSPTTRSLGESGQSADHLTKEPEKVIADNVVTKPLAQTHIKSTLLTTIASVKPLPIKIDRWHWPVKGQVIQTYRANDTSRKGIGIRGKPGQAVKAAAAGTVVYSGNGLINYGNLVIIKHSHSFLSAYAYNQLLLVKEGDSVKRGQSIAQMGKVDQKPQLHFEIRRNGKPVNPLNYLPKK